MSLIMDYIMESTLDGIEWTLRRLLEANMSVLEGVTDIASVTPTEWLGGEPWNLAEQLAATVMVPVAGIILTYVLCMDFIQIFLDKNNYHEFEMFTLFKFVLKTGIFVLIINHALDIVAGTFAVGAYVTKGAGVFINTEYLSPDNIDELMLDMRDSLKDNSMFELVPIMFQTLILFVTTFAVRIIATVVVYGRIMEITIRSSLAPIPIATFGNREWNIGNNYVRGLFALSFQGFLIIFIIGLYIIITATIDPNDMSNLEGFLGVVYGRLGWSVVLCVTLLKTGSISKSILNAH